MSSDQDRTISSSGHDITPLSPEAKREKSKDLDELARWVANEAGTERPFTGKYYKEKAPGLYVCAVCGLPLFAAETKYESGSGWPSFYDAIDSDHVLKVPEIPGTGRIELRCARSGTHLGHVFPDGPAPTGQRYCVNSASLDFIAEGAELPQESRPVAESERDEEAGAIDGADATPLPVATFGAGCFWGVEAAFRQLDGVVATQVGYTGGTVEQPTYHQVCADRTGHAEAVEVRFDPQRVSYEKLLATFWSSHDPTQLDRQGPDVGSQYRSAIFFHDEEQRQAALASQAELEESRHFSRPIATEITPAVPFYRAEEYHQQYLEKNGTMSCPTHLAP